MVLAWLVLAYMYLNMRVVIKKRLDDIIFRLNEMREHEVRQAALHEKHHEKLKALMREKRPGHVHAPCRQRNLLGQPMSF